MAINLGKAKSLTSGGEAFIEKDLITDDSNVVITHTDTNERGDDLQVDQTLQMETPQPVKTFQNIDPSWLVNVSSDRRITSITFEAFTALPTTDAVLIIRRAGNSFYQKTLGVITAGSETTFDLTGPGFTPIDLIDATAYTFTILSQTGLQIDLIGDFPNFPFYKWEYHDLTTKELGYKDDVYPIVKTSVEGIEFEQAMGLQTGGNCLFQSDRVLDQISALVVHGYNVERAADRAINVSGFFADAPVWTIDADTLTNPTATFTAADDLRLIDIQIRSAGAQTNVLFTISHTASGKTVWQSMIASMPASGTFKIDFTDTAESNVPIDAIDTVQYDFSFSSLDGDVLLLGETATDQPWLTVSAYPFSNEDIAYLSDLVGTDGTFHVDLNTSTPSADRDGGILTPFISMTEALAAVGAATVTAQHAFLISSGNYAESFVLPIYSHMVSLIPDPTSVRFNQVTYNSNTGSASITRCRVADIIYDTTAGGGSTNSVLRLNEVDSFSDISITGRGAGSDTVIINQLAALDDISSATNVNLQILNCRPLTLGTGNINILGNASAGNLDANSQAATLIVENSDFSAGGTVGVTGDTAATTYKVLNSDMQTCLTTGNSVSIERDANSVFGIVPFSGTPTIVNLDKIEQVDTGENIVWVETEADFGTIVPATRIDVTPNTTFYLKNTSTTQTLPFVLADGTSMLITALSRSSTLLYTNATEPQFQGNDIALSLTDVNLDGNSTATAFDLDGGILSLKFPNFNRYEDIGEVKNLVDFFAPGCFFDVISGGLTLTNCSSATIYSALILQLDGNTFNFLTIRGPRTGNDGDMQFNTNICNNDDFGTFIRIDPDVPEGKHISITGNNVTTPGNTFDTAGATGTFTVVADAAVASTTINSVTDSSGTARFNFTVGPTVFVNQEIINTGFVTNTAYNGTFLITATGAGFFEAALIDFGTDEASGSFTSASVTMTDTATTLVDGDTVTIDTDLATDYDGGATVYNQLTNTFQINRTFTVTQTGGWSTEGLNQKNPKVLAVGNAGGSTSEYILSSFVTDNATAIAGMDITNGVFRDMVLGTAGSALVEGSNMERWKLIDDVNATHECISQESVDTGLSYKITAVSSGGAQVFRFKWQIDRGAGFVDLDDNVVAKVEIGSEIASVTDIVPIAVTLGDRVKPVFTRDAGSSGVVFEDLTIFSER